MRPRTQNTQLLSIILEEGRREEIWRERSEMERVERRERKEERGERFGCIVRLVLAFKLFLWSVTEGCKLFSLMSLTHFSFLS